MLSNMAVSDDTVRVLSAFCILLVAKSLLVEVSTAICVGYWGGAEA